MHMSSAFKQPPSQPQFLHRRAAAAAAAMSSVPEIEEEEEVSGGDSGSGEPGLVFPERRMEETGVNAAGGGGEVKVDAASSDRCKGSSADAKVRNTGVNPVQNGKGKEELGVLGKARNVDPMCINASNPYHRCTEKCSRRADVTRRNTLGGKSAYVAIPLIQNGGKKKEENRVMGRRNINPMCINASNPYHQCREYCSRKTPESKNQTKGAKSAESAKILKMGCNRKVDPRCVNASNPFHECTECCSQHNNIITQNGRGKSEASSAIVTRGLRRDVNPKCINASNPYHKCAHYCVHRLQEAS